MGSREMPRAAVAVLLAAACVPVLGACAGTEDEPDLVAGKKLYVERCGSCHTLARAETKGTQGPNLDEAFRQAERDGFGRSAIEGVVRSQIDNPRRGSIMPADLVTGEEAADVSAYVAKVAAAGGKDEGLLADAVPKAGGGEPIAAKDGVLSIAADPTGQLLYVSDQATAPAGPLKVQSPNESGVPHNIVIDGKGEGEVVQDGGVSEFDADFTAGEYQFYCSVPGHKAAGMEGTLKVE